MVSGEGFDDTLNGRFMGNEIGRAIMFVERFSGGIADHNAWCGFEGFGSPVVDKGFNAGGAGEKEDVGGGQGGVMNGVVVVEDGVGDVCAGLA